MNIEKFKNWLKNHGCQILPNTNEYELVRWKGSKIGVVYNTHKTSGEYASGAVGAFIRKKTWDGGPEKAKRKGSYKKKRDAIRKRDGENCFYCGMPLDDDETFEHILELNQGGINNITNGVLAHSECNQKMARKTVSEKVKFAIEQRIKLKK